MKELKARKGRPKIVEDDELTAELIRKAKRRVSNRFARKYEKYWLDLDKIASNENEKPHIRMQAFEKIIKMIDKYQEDVENGLDVIDGNEKEETQAEEEQTSSVISMTMIK